MPSCALNYREPIVAPSLLAADWSVLRHEIERIETAGADWLHMDVMDGNFVDNISFGPAFVATTHRCATKPLDVHLMIQHPDHYLDRFLPLAMNVTVHVEATHDAGATLAKIRKAGCLAGLSLKPATPITAVLPYLDSIDLLLVMTVVPGFGGQAFMPETVETIVAAAEHRERNGLSFHIQVDGGINAETAAICRNAGANVFVAGTSVFKAQDPAAAITGIRGEKSQP